MAEFEASLGQVVTFRGQAGEWVVTDLLMEPTPGTDVAIEKLTYDHSQQPPVLVISHAGGTANVTEIRDVQPPRRLNPDEIYAGVRRGWQLEGFPPSFGDDTCRRIAQAANGAVPSSRKIQLP